MRFGLFSIAVLSAIILSGCGDVPRARIHGIVTYQGLPLNEATIIFIASDNKTHLAKLKADGSYEVSGVAQGAVKVSIQQDLPKIAPRPDPGSGGGSKAAVVDEKANRRRSESSPAKREDARLPTIYTDPDISGLVFELKDSDKEWSIDLK
jgi:hypothetical protein